MTQSISGSDVQRAELYKIHIFILTLKNVGYDEIHRFLIYGQNWIILKLHIVLKIFWMNLITV